MKKSLLLLMLLAFLLPWALNAQTTVEIGTSAGTSTNSYLPGYTLYDNTLSEQIYTAEEVTMAGTISSVAFYNGGSEKSPTVTLYMVNTDKEAFSSISDWLVVTSGDKVFEGSVTFTANEWTTITLDTPFDYDGTSNLGLVAHVHMNSYSSGLSCRVFTSTDYCSMYKYRDNTVFDPTNPGVTGTRLGVKNQIKLDITPGSGPTCEKPSTFEVSNVEAHSASFAWTSEVGNYTFEYKKASDADWTIVTGLADVTYSLSNLDAATSYNARVKAVCGIDLESGYKTASFTTPCAAYDIPYEYGFEDATPFSCWNAVSGVSIESSHARTGSKNLKFQGAKPLVILPAFADPINTLRLEIWARPESTTSNSGKLEVGYVTDPSDTATFVAVATFVNTDWASSSYEKKAIDFDNAPAGATMAMRQHDHSSSWYWFVDDITVKEKPSCFAPTALDADNITTNSAVLSWTANSGESEWKLYYKKASADDFSDAISVASKPYTLEGLDAATAYQFYVQAVCGASDESEASDIAKFVTACDAISAPWSENFDSYSGASSTSAPDGYPDDELPICWQFLNRSANTSTYPQAFISSSSAYAVSGNCLFFKSSSTTPLYAILPEFVEDIAGLQLTFTYRNEGTSESNGTLHIGYMTDPNDVSTFISVLECPRISSLTEKVVLFDNAPSGSYIAFKYQGGTASNYYLSIDNVSVDVKPSCLKPSALMLETPSSRTAHAASLKWTKGEESQSAWEIAYSKLANFNPDEQITDSIASADSNPFTLSGLEQSTTYYAYVRANCGAEDGKSAWSSNKASFTTLSGHQALSNLALVDGSLGSQSAEVNWKPNAYNELHASYEIYYSKLSTLPTTEEALSSDSLIQNISDTFYVFSNLDPETQYYVWVRDNCATDGLSAWSSRASFTTLANCAVPFNLTASEETAHGAKLAWEGNSDSYEISVSKIEIDKSYEYNFEDGQFPAALTHSGTYGFEIVSGKSESGNYCVKSSNGGVYSSTAEMVLEVNLSEASTLSFLAKISSESGWDKGGFSINGTVQSGMNDISGDGAWIAYNYNLPAGTHTLRWYYTKDSSGDTNDDCLYVDDIVIGVSSVVPVENYPVSESPYVLNDAAKIDPETTYLVTVKGICGGNPTEASTAVQFTTLPSCLPVSGLAVDNVTASSANFIWADNSLQDKWQFAYAKDGDAPVWEGGNIVEEKLASISNLDPNTSYNFYVRAYCGVDDHSEAIKLNFRTECGIITVTFDEPYVEDFEDPIVTTTYSQAGQMPDCWEGYPATYAGPKILAAGATYNFASSGQVLYFYGSGNNYAVLPKFSNPLNDLQISFKWATESASYGTLTLGYITDGDEDFNTFKAIKAFPASSESDDTFVPENIFLDTLPASASKLVFRWYYSGQWGCNVDDIVIRLANIVDINASEYATYFNSEKAYIMPAGVTGHAFANGVLSDAIYQSADVVPAAIPLVLHGPAGSYLLASSSEAGTPLEVANDLIGVNVETEIEDESGYLFYVLSLNAANDVDSVGFYWMNSTGAGGFTMPAHKAYLKYAASAAPARFYLFNGENGATWLENLEGVEGTVKFMHEGNIYILRDSIIYDATGRKVRELK